MTACREDLWPADRACPTCEGHGGFGCRQWSGDGWEWDEVECYACDGTGTFLWMMPKYPSPEIAPEVAEIFNRAEF